MSRNATKRHDSPFFDSHFRDRIKCHSEIGSRAANKGQGFYALWSGIPARVKGFQVAVCCLVCTARSRAPRVPRIVARRRRKSSGFWLGRVAFCTKSAALRLFSRRRLPTPPPRAHTHAHTAMRWRNASSNPEQAPAVPAALSTASILFLNTTPPYNNPETRGRGRRRRRRRNRRRGR